MLTAVVTPAVAPGLDLPPPSLGVFLLALATESLAGLFLGIMLRLFIIAIQTAGAIAAQSTSLSQLLGQSGLDPLPAIGHILTTAALALMMATGFHVKAAAFLVLSYELLPVLQFPNPADVAEAGRHRVGRALRSPSASRRPSSALGHLQPDPWRHQQGDAAVDGGLRRGACDHIWCHCAAVRLGAAHAVCLVAGLRGLPRRTLPVERHGRAGRVSRKEPRAIPAQARRGPEKGRDPRAPDLLTAMSYLGMLRNHGRGGRIQPDAVRDALCR